MEKITRRFFLGASAALVFVPWSWMQARMYRPRRTASRLWRRFHRWRTGMQPRWSDWSSTTFHRSAVAQDGSPMPYKIIDNWRELRWPDTGELVERVTLESEMQMLCMDITYDSAAGIDFRGGVDWNPNELGHRLPGPKCATPDELIDKVRHAAMYDLEPNPDGDPEIAIRNRWIADAKATVEKWDRDPRFNSAADAKAFAELEAGALPIIERVRGKGWRRPDFVFLDFGFDDKG